MTLPEWTIISKYGSQVIPHLPELSDLAIAEVDATGVILSINALGKQSWEWQEGMRLPNALLIALSEVKRGESLALPIKPGGLSLLGVRMEAGRGWLLIGYRSPEERLAERASSFKSLIEKIPVLITRMRADGIVLYANTEANRMTGYAADEIIGRPFWLEAVHPEDRWKLMGAVRRALEGEKAIVGVRFLTRRRGPRLAEMHLYPATEPGRAPGEAQVEGVVFDVTERSEVEEALFQSEALYRTFLEQSPIGMLHLDATGVVTFENHQFRQIIGEAADDAWIGRTIFEIPGLDARLWPLLRRMLESGEAFHAAEATYAGRTDVPTQYLVVHGSPILHPEGGIVGGVLMIEDVTQQKHRDEELHLRGRYSQAETALRKSALADPNEETFLQEAARILGETARAARLHMLVNNAANACCTARAAWVKPGLPVAPAVVIDRREYGLLERVERDHQVLHVHAADATGPAHALLDATGAAEAVWAPFYEEGQLGGFALFEHTDGPAPRWQGTELHLVEQLVRLFETLWAWIRVGNRYRHIISTIDDCLFNFTFDEHGERRYLFATHQLAALTGYTPDEIVVRDRPALRWHDVVVHPGDRAAVRLHDEALRQGQESRVSYRVQHRSGQTRWLQERSTPQPDPTGAVTVSGILSDVTEQKAAEAILLEAKHQAESANQLKSVFIATMSHEIRTPMGAVNGFAELLARELEEVEEQTGTVLPAQVLEFLQAIRENSQKLLTLVNDLFDLSNLEVGSIKVRRAAVPLHEVVLRCTSKVAVALSQKAIDLRVDLDPSEPAASTDPQRLEQVLDNLLSNAAKFTDEGTVVVRTRPWPGDAVAIEVIDTGVGIAPEYLERLFTPFLQEDNRLNRRYEGSGLGLALVKRLLDLMDGRIEVESKKGEGSTFRIILPSSGTAAPLRWRSTRTESH